MKGALKMYMNNVGNVMGTAYQYANRTQTKTVTSHFAGEVQKATEIQEYDSAKSTSKWDGDMVITLHEKMSGIEYDSSLDGKSKEDMTLDEYKQWYRNQVSKMPVSAFVASTFVSSQLIIKDECFERMKNDPEWEQKMLNMTRGYFGANGLIGSKAIGYQVLGASPEECYGAGIPVKNDSGIFSTDNDESWWQKRHEEFEKLLEEQAKAAQKKAKENRALAQEEYMNRQFENEQRLRAFLESRMQDSQDITPTSGAASVTTAATAYENAISIFSNSVMDNI